MQKEKAKITLTEFMNFVNKSGSAKLTVVSQSKQNRLEDYQEFKDYWLRFRQAVKNYHRQNQDANLLYSVLENIDEKKRDNYEKNLTGYLHYVGKKKCTWIEPPKKTWSVDSIQIELNPEIGLVYKGTTYFIKLFLQANHSIDKKHADLILSIMEHEMRDKVDEHVIFAVLDVKRGKLFKSTEMVQPLYLLLEEEARMFGHLWTLL